MQDNNIIYNSSSIDTFAISTVKAYLEGNEMLKTCIYEDYTSLIEGDIHVYQSNNHSHPNIKGYMHFLVFAFDTNANTGEKASMVLNKSHITIISQENECCVFLVNRIMNEGNVYKELFYKILSKEDMEEFISHNHSKLLHGNEDMDNGLAIELNIAPSSHDFEKIIEETMLTKHKHYNLSVSNSQLAPLVDFLDEIVRNYNYSGDIQQLSTIRKEIDYLLSIDAANDYNRGDLLIPILREISYKSSEVLDDFNYGQLLFYIAKFHHDFEMYDSAEKYYQMSLPLIDSHEDEEAKMHNQAVIKNNMAVLCCKKNDYLSAKKYYDESILLFDKLAQNYSRIYNDDLERVNKNIHANENVELNSSSKEQMYQDVLKEYKQLAKNEPDTYSPKIVNVLSKIALLYQKSKKYELAEECFLEMLKIRKEQIDLNPIRYNPTLLIKPLCDIGSLHISMKKYKLAESDYTKALEICQENSSYDYAKIVTILVKLGGIHEQTEQTNEAENNYSQALSVLRKHKIGNNHLRQLCGVLQKLGELHQAVNRLEEAKEEFAEAKKMMENVSKDMISKRFFDNAESNCKYILKNVEDGTEKFDNNKFVDALNKCQELVGDDSSRLVRLAILIYETGNLYRIEFGGNQENEYIERAEQIKKYLFDNELYDSLVQISNVLKQLGQKFYNVKKYADAIYFNKEVLSIVRKISIVVPDAYLPLLASALNNIGNNYNHAKEFSNADDYYQESLAIYRELSDTNPDTYLPLLASALNNIGNHYSHANEFVQARVYFQESLAIYRELSDTNPDTYLPLLASALNNIGNNYNHAKEFSTAYDYYQESLAIYRELSNTNPDTYLPPLASALNNIGNNYSHAKEFVQARVYYQESLAIYRELSDTNPDTYLPLLASALNNIGNNYNHAKEFSTADDCYQESLAIYRELSNTNPDTYLPPLASALNNIGNNYNHAKEFVQARVYYQESLAIYRELSDTNPDTYLPLLASILNNIGNNYNHAKEFSTADDCYQESLAIYRELSDTNPDTYLPLLASILNNIGNNYNHAKEFSTANDYYQESLAIYRELSDTNPDTYLPLLASALNNIGNNYNHAKEFSTADDCYQESLAIYRELSDTNPDTYLPLLASALNNIGNNYRFNHEFVKAELAYNESLKLYTELVQQGHIFYKKELTKVNHHLVKLYEKMEKEKQENGC